MSASSPPPDPAADPAVQETQFTHPADQEQQRERSTNGSAAYGAILTLHHSPRTANSSLPVPPAAKTPSPRALAPDLLRGLLMVLQAIDHSALSVGAWRHGVAIETEADGQVVTKWNYTIASICRTLTHLCAPGFVFLLGMGVVYFGRSRRRIGWGAGQMAKHFALRAFALAAVNQAIITVIGGRLKFWIINPILLTLAVDYFLVGMVWLGLDASESAVKNAIAKRLDNKSMTTEQDEDEEDESQPLVANRNANQLSATEIRATRISYHIHNGFLFILSAVSLYMNNILSPDGGRCSSNTSTLTTADANIPFVRAGHGIWIDIWFYPVMDKDAGIASMFPPLGWISFAFLGLLYARLVIPSSQKQNDRSNTKINLYNVCAGIVFFLLFVSTRLLHWGNLSEDCLQMPEHTAHPHLNQYLASFRSFFYIIKYPPSFAYAALTMSANFLLLAFFGAIPVRYASKMQPLLAYGTSALFFYITHLLLYETLGIPIKAYLGHDLGWNDPFEGKPARGVGPTWIFWATWLFGLALLYPACKGYGAFKARKGVNSVWRFF